MGILTLGILNLEEEKHHLRRIKCALKRRGMRPEIETEGWEIHGPQSGMDYQVYVGPASYIPEPKDKCICPKGNELSDCPVHGSCYVVIYPRAVYQLEDDMSQWWNVRPEDRIWTKEKL